MLWRTSLVHLPLEADEAKRAEFEALVASRLLQEVPQGTHSHLGANLPGTVNGGDYTWDLAFANTEAHAAFCAHPFWLSELAPALEALDARCDTVFYCLAKSGLPEPQLGKCIKRTLLLRIPDEVPSERVQEFEEALVKMPDYIRSIRNWGFARVDQSLHASRWTHVWLQEFEDLDGLLGEYMLHPYHWGFIDGWFDAECARQIVDPHLAHVFCEAPSSVLGWNASPQATGGSS